MSEEIQYELWTVVHEHRFGTSAYHLKLEKSVSKDTPEFQQQVIDFAIEHFGIDFEPDRENLYATLDTPQTDACVPASQWHAFWGQKAEKRKQLVRWLITDDGCYEDSPQNREKYLVYLQKMLPNYPVNFPFDPAKIMLRYFIEADEGNVEDGIPVIGYLGYDRAPNTFERTKTWTDEDDGEISEALYVANNNIVRNFVGDDNNFVTIDLPPGYTPHIENLMHCALYAGSRKIACVIRKPHGTEVSNYATWTITAPGDDWFNLSAIKKCFESLLKEEK